MLPALSFAKTFWNFPREHTTQPQSTLHSYMEEAKGVAKHVLLAKFKDDVSPAKIEELIHGYADLVNHIEPMKSFQWGKDVSIENLHQGFTHIFESTFESTEGIAEYVSHPKHVDFANLFLGHLDKVLVIDYKPTTLHR